MNITILNIAEAPATTKTGKPYTVLDIAFKNNTFQGKTEGKKLNPYGANEPAFKALQKAQAGQTYEINVVKNASGFNDWVSAVLADAAPQSSGQIIGGYAARPAASAQPARVNTFETPEERAKKQVYIIRQSSLSTAVATLAVGAKAVKPDDVLTTAKLYEDYVFGKDTPLADGSGFDDMSDDVPL